MSNVTGNIFHYDDWKSDFFGKSLEQTKLRPFPCAPTNQRFQSRSDSVLEARTPSHQRLASRTCVTTLTSEYWQFQAWSCKYMCKYMCKYCRWHNTVLQTRVDALRVCGSGFLLHPRTETVEASATVTRNSKGNRERIMCTLANLKKSSCIWFSLSAFASTAEDPNELLRKLRNKLIWICILVYIHKFGSKIHSAIVKFQRRRVRLSAFGFSLGIKTTHTSVRSSRTGQCPEVALER